MPKRYTPTSAAADVEAALRLLEGRWKLVILFHLFGGKVMRFSDLERAIPNITQKMLGQQLRCQDRKSTRLNSSHGYISYAVFCLKKKKIHQRRPIVRAKRYREQFRHVKRRRDHK